jgi:glycosyltransferase involved in cell wall biosynthesis
MRDRGYAVTVVSLAPAGPVGQRLQADGIRVRSCEGQGGWDLRVIPRLSRIIHDESPDLIHALLFHANLASRWAAERAAFPASRVICEIQTVEVERRWHLWVDRLSYDGCRFIIGNSPSVIEHLATNANVPRERLRLVRGGIDPEPIRRAEPLDRTTLGLSPDSRMILWVGRLDPVKGLHTLLDAFAQWIHLPARGWHGQTRLPVPAKANADSSAFPSVQSPARTKGLTQNRAATVRERRNSTSRTGIESLPDAELFLAGGGSLHDELITRAKRLSIDQRVHFLGPRNDVPSLLKTCDLFVFPSRTEGLPNALLEAMAAACPIVTTDVPGCRDLIRHEETGLLVPFGDTAALASAIARLLTDRPLAHHLGTAASADIDQHWHVRNTLDAYEAAYQDALCDSLAP